MQTVYAYSFTASRWAAGWRHLDREYYVGQVKLTPPRQLESGNGYDDGGTYVQFCRVPSTVNTADLKTALCDTLSGSRCRHEYDCCGCASRYVTVKQIAPRRLAVYTRVTYNY